MTFTLPRLTQELYTRWFDKKIPNTDEHIVYPGRQLPCMTKTSALKNSLKPEHVFITKSKSSGNFFHRVLGDDGIFAYLPKRLYAMVYPNILFNTIPENNRIKVKLSNRRSIMLPYIPDSFFEQKKKSGRRSSSRPKRQREQKSEPQQRSKKPYRGWNPPANTTQIDKDTLIGNIKAVIANIDEKGLEVLPPFQGSKLDENNETEFSTICKFVYHYARSELGITPIARELKHDRCDDVTQKITQQ